MIKAYRTTFSPLAATRAKIINYLNVLIMKTLTKQSLKMQFCTKILYLAIIILIGYSCDKENSLPNIDFEFHANEIIYYPDKHISITFDIIPNDEIGSYTINWFNPDTLSGDGPFEINITNDISLDFNIADNNNRVQRFEYEIRTDTIDSVMYDYRNNYIGTYICNVTYDDGTTIYNHDTLTVVKNNAFNMLDILTKKDIERNWEGNKMTYLNSGGYYTSPTGSFYGYHSEVLFSNDSIHYTKSGPLGAYYTNVYDGIKMGQ